MNVRQLAGRIESDAVTARGTPQTTPTGTVTGRSFEDLLQAATSGQQPFTISAHAQQRIGQRGINLDETRRNAIHNAFEVLQSKGSKDALLLDSDAAFIVNVPGRTIVTALDQSEMQQRVFTQIDSALLL